MSGRVRKRPVVVLSADPDILKLSDAFVRKRITVVADLEVPENPCDILHAGGYYLVISHGGVDGSVQLQRSDWVTARTWLSTRTKPVPDCERLLLFCCWGGKSLHRLFKKRSVWGHRGPIPVPTGIAAAELLPYYIRGLELLVETSDVDTWSRELQAHARLRRKITFARSTLSPVLGDHLIYRVWDTILETFKNHSE